MTIRLVAWLWPRSRQERAGPAVQLVCSEPWAPINLVRNKASGLAPVSDFSIGPHPREEGGGVYAPSVQQPRPCPSSCSDLGRSSTPSSSPEPSREGLACAWAVLFLLSCRACGWRIRRDGLTWAGQELKDLREQGPKCSPV